MFGYIVMNKPEIKFKDFDLYRSFTVDCAENSKVNMEYQDRFL